MEYFYRDMRRKTGLLMTGDQPEGGAWNYDAENRKPAGDDLFMPKPVQFKPDAITQDVLTLVASRFSDHIGTLEPFGLAVTADQANKVLTGFLKNALPRFGDYQDAMLQGEPFLYHSLVSAYINAGLLDPLTVCRKVEAEYHKGRVPLNAAEGYIRQIIGWREYVRGIYWLKMPGYDQLNFFGNKRKLPQFYWTADTHMLCVKSAVQQTIDEAYAHHIQRLMVTGNFAMMAGIDPHEVHEWYLAVYADAYEWVELPNTLGMSQFGDGGLLGSKPYAASGNYINKMSNYCKNCHYDVSAKAGDKACPFNPLYWDFLVRNESKLKSNPRLGQVYNSWHKMTDDKKQDYCKSAAAILKKLDSGQKI
jgi:deoxyribodipyrimidine photolyase-related protein